MPRYLPMLTSSLALSPTHAPIYDYAYARAYSYVFGDADAYAFAFPYSLAYAYAYPRAFGYAHVHTRALVCAHPSPGALAGDARGSNRERTKVSKEEPSYFRKRPVHAYDLSSNGSPSCPPTCAGGLWPTFSGAGPRNTQWRRVCP